MATKVKDWTKMSQKEWSYREKMNQINDRKDPSPKKGSKK